MNSSAAAATSSSVSPFAAQADMAMQQKMPSLTSGNNNIAATRKAATEFESVFASQMLTQMFSGVKTDAMFGGGSGEEMYKSLLIDEYGKQIAKRGSLGVADSIMHTLLSEQEKSR